MKTVVQHYIGTTKEWKIANPLLYKAVWGFEITRKGKLYVKVGNGIDRWNELKYFDAENIKGLPERLAAIEAAIAALDEAIKREAEERKAADLVLEQAIEAEAEERKAADQVLEEAIETEAEERKAADQELQAAFAALEKTIETETEERKAADKVLTDAFETLEAEIRHFLELIDISELERVAEAIEQYNSNADAFAAAIATAIATHNTSSQAHEDLREELWQALRATNDRIEQIIIPKVEVVCGGCAMTGGGSGSSGSPAFDLGIEEDGHLYVYYEGHTPPSLYIDFEADSGTYGHLFMEMD